ncbi:ArsR/SmtB family transcription factor [Cellulomonas soli]
MTMNGVLHDHPGVPAGEHAHGDVVQVLHALADPTRLSIVHLLAQAPRRVVELTAALGLAQSTVSAHLATLRSAGLVDGRAEGRATRYALTDPELDDLLGAAERVVARAGARVEPRPGHHGEAHGGRRTASRADVVEHQATAGGPA